MAPGPGDHFGGPENELDKIKPRMIVRISERDDPANSPADQPFLRMMIVLNLFVWATKKR